ncbi:MAG: HigA family addiction module antitoxin [Rhodocyclaceae bacterium]|nr:HigA family addiction module antitoxin [Rhodocyclaceae bacterium]
MSRMHNPAHPGEILRDLWLAPLNISVTTAAEKLAVSRKTLSKIVNGSAGISADMALRLAAWLGTTADLWLGMQLQWELWQASQQPRPEIRQLERLAA